VLLSARDREKATEELDQLRRGERSMRQTEPDSDETTTLPPSGDAAFPRGTHLADSAGNAAGRHQYLRGKRRGETGSPREQDLNSGAGDAGRRFRPFYLERNSPRERRSPDRFKEDRS
jgi:hypothetical protein